MRKKIHSDISAVIGKTPLVYLDRFSQGTPARLAGKLEYLNPGGSLKDRVTLTILDEAEREGFLRRGGTIVEASCGNSGVSLAMISAIRGYRLILIMPENAHPAQVRLLQSYGAQVVLTRSEEGMRGSIAQAERMAEDDFSLFLPRQFSNPSNPAAHERTTAVEIWEDSGEEVDVVVAGAGTGGTLSGIGAYLKRRPRPVQVVAVEPAGSPVLSGGCPGRHGIHGLGPGFIPPVLRRDLLDEVIAVTDQEAEDAAARLLRTEGIPAGVSSGAVSCAALKLAARRQNRGKLIVAVLADSFRQHASIEVKLCD